MKKRIILIAMLSLLFSISTSVFAQETIIPTQEQICTWQKIKETPYNWVSSLAEGGTSSVNGSTVTVNYMGLSTEHTWTAPGAVLTPGEELYFEVSTSWDLDKSQGLNSTGGINTYVNFNFVSRVEAHRKSINFNAEPSGSIENSTSWIVPGGNPGTTMEIIGAGDAAVGGGSVRYKYQFVCVDPTPTDTETPQPSATPEATVSITPTPGQCEELTEDQKLEKILDLYYAQIPKGITKSGTTNNIYDFLGYEGYDEFACGGYQSKVLNFLNEIKFSKDPCEQALLDKWDYGPIQAWWGGHQAVVIYPWATNWMETGTVLDPWITQFPAAYKVKDWAIYFSVAGTTGEPGRIVDWAIDGSFIGIGPSEVYRKTGAYPLFGGDYVQAGMQGLTKEELDFIKTLPVEKQELFKKLTKAQQKYWLDLKLSGKNKAQQVVSDCPVTLYVTNEEGLRSGISTDGVYNELSDVLFNVHPLNDGTLYSEILYPMEAGYRLVMEGTGDGPAHVLVQSLTDFEATDETIAMYDLTVNQGILYESMLPDDEIVCDDGAIQSTLIAKGTEPVWLNNLPGLMAVGDEVSQSGSNPDWLPGWRTLFIGGFILVVLGLIGFAVLTVLVVPDLLSRGQKSNPSIESKRKGKWIIAMIVMVIACLITSCGALSLYLGITGR